MSGRDREPPSDEPYVKQWPRRTRLAVILIAALGSWGLVIGGALLLWRHRS
jgi:hypothetical protein